MLQTICKPIHILYKHVISQSGRFYDPRAVDMPIDFHGFTAKLGQLKLENSHTKIECQIVFSTSRRWISCAALSPSVDA